MNIALVGNQNCGKTTLFNALTGSNQKVGNWAGVTIEKKTGIIKGTSHSLIDLPGIYSLTPYTAEEIISCNYIINEKPDLIINLVDSTCLERSLYLTTQLIQLNCKIILALNMCELLEKKGQAINEETLSKLLSLPVLKISALKNTNLDKLINLINENSLNTSSIKIFPDKVENLLEEISNQFTPKINKFCATKIIEKQIDYINKFFKLQCNDQILSINKKIINIENLYKLDISHILAMERYKFLSNVINKSLYNLVFNPSSPKKPSKHKKNLFDKISFKKRNKKLNSIQRNITEKLDNIFLNKYLAIPIFILIMALVYFLSVGIVGKFSTGLIDSGFNALSNLVELKLTSLGASSWIISLICNGIIAGVGAVLNFVPQLIILFLCITLLETTGYMSRISFIFDKLFRAIGLSGKSLIPFIVGSGCSVPAIMSTRTIENSDEKQTTIMVTPFIPCSAKLPIITLFTSYFFIRSWLVTTFLYILSIFLIVISSFIIRKFILTEKNNTFIFELPEYKKPSFKYIFKDVFTKTISFVKRAGTIILVCSVIIWFLVSFNWSLNYGVNIENSILASIGNMFAWIFYPILNSYSWAATVSAIQGLIAKEQVVSSMAIIAGLSNEASGNLIFSANGIFSFFTPVTAISFLIFNLFSAPCFGAIGAMHKELGSTKKTIIAISFQTLTALILATLTSFIGNLIMLIF